MFVVATPAFGETIKSENFSIEIDTKDACVIVPEGRRAEPACSGVEPLPTELQNIDEKKASYVFLASMPLAPPARHWLGVIRLRPEPDGIDRNGLTVDALHNTERSLRAIVSREGSWQVGTPSTSSIATTNDVDRASIELAVAPKNDAAHSYIATFSLYFGKNDYVVETFAEEEQRYEAAKHLDAAVRTMNIAPREHWNPAGAAASTLSVMPMVWLTGAFLVVMGLVVRDARARKEKKPQRNKAAIDLPRYATARRLGLLFALSLCSTVVIELLSYTFPTSGALLRALASFVSFASLAPMLLWVHRVTINARVLGCAGIPTATMAVTWFFVPIASIFMPYRSIADVAASMRGPGRMDAVWRVALFWIPMVGMYASRAFEWTVAGTLCAAVATLGAWSMVVAIDQGQTRMFRKEKKRRKVSAAQLVDAT